MSDQRTSADIFGQLELIRSQLSRIHHDLNNPLSVISGNAELLAGLSRALGVDEDLGGPIDDLTTAVDQLTENVDRLLAVRGLLSELTKQLDGTS
ncbi:MAG: histidine kinase dimerization/phospho-acceptor domain-containing protein [Rhodothermales bacterium]